MSINETKRNSIQNTLHKINRFEEGQKDALNINQKAKQTFAQEILSKANQKNALLTNEEKEVILKKLDDVGEINKPLESNETTEQIWDEKNKRWISPPDWNLIDTMDLQVRKRDENKKSDRWSKLSQEEREILRVELNKKEMIRTTPNSEKYLFGNAWTKTKIYTDLMKQDPDLIENMYRRVFNGEDKVMVSEILISYIEDHYNISTIKDKKTEMWLETNGIIYPNAELFIQEIVRAVFGEKFNPQLCTGIIKKIQSDTFIESENFFKEADERYIPLKNGVYDIKTKSMVNIANKGRFFSRINLKYTYTAKCPNFIKHLKDVLSNEEDINCMQELFGFCLLRRYSFEKFFIWLGNGRNGKDKTAEVLKYMLGENNCTSINLDTLEKSPMMVCNLHRRHANIIGELKQDRFMGSEMLKSTVGNSLITADRKFLPPVTFINYAKHVILTNELKEMGDTTDAFFERLIIFEFPYQFKLATDYADLTKEELATGRYKLADPFHIKKLSTKEELEGVLAWSIEGLHRLLDQGGFSTSKTTLETKRLFLRKANNLTAFMEEHVDYSYGEWVEKKKFRYLYNMFCKYNKVVPLNDRGIKGTLDKFGAVGRQINNKTTNHMKKYVWEGVKFKDSINILINWMKENGFEDPNDIPDEKPDGIYIEEVTAEDFLQGGK